MANMARNAAGIMAVGAILLSPHGASAADDPTVISIPGSHVRSDSTELSRLIDEAKEQSPTFRRLVETIDARDGIVFIQQGACGGGVRACLYAVSAAAQHRMLWVKVDTRKRLDRFVMGSIGHELRHAIEVLDEPSVTSSSMMYFLYQRIGYRSTSHSAETRAATSAGNEVRGEVNAFNRRSKVH